MQMTGKIKEESSASEQNEPVVRNWEVQKPAKIDEKLRASTSEVVECELIEIPKDFYISDDELATYCLKLSTGHADGKLRIYDKVLKADFTTAEFVKFVKEEYGSIYMGGADEFHKSISASPKGLIIERLTGGKLILSWNITAGRIKRLCESGEYLNAIEHERYVKWKATQDGLKVIVDKTTKNLMHFLDDPEGEGADEAYENVIKATDILLKPKEKENTNLLNLKNDKARKAWLDAFRAWGVWVEVKEVSKTFYRYNFANGCAVVVEVGIEYGDGYSIKKGEREILKYSILDSEHPKFDTHGISYTAVIQWLSQHGKEV